LPASVTSTKILRAVAALARDLDLQCVVEGVETAAQLAALPPGVNVQGYLLGRPVPPQECLEVIASGAGLPALPAARGAARSSTSPAARSPTGCRS